MNNYLNSKYQLLKYRNNRNKISAIQKDKLFNLVINLKERTEKQKRRFIMYYGLDKQNKYKKYTYNEISQIEKVSVTAIRISVIRVKNNICSLEKII